MVGLDTNVLVRIIVGDDEGQKQKALKFIKQTTDCGKKLIVNSAVVCEIVWVLETSYEYNKNEIISALNHLLQMELSIIDEPAVRLALNLYSVNSLDFADALIAFINKTHGAEFTATFDKKAAKTSNYKIIN